MADQVVYNTSLGCYQNYPTYVHTYSVYTRYIGRLEGARTHAPTHSYTDTHTQIHTHTHTHTHTCTGTDQHTYIFIHTHTYKQTYMYMMQPTYVQTVFMYVRTCFRILYQLMMREPLAIHFNWFTIKLVSNNKLKIWVCILWIFDRLQIREKQ